MDFTSAKLKKHLRLDSRLTPRLDLGVGGTAQCREQPGARHGCGAVFPSTTAIDVATCRRYQLLLPSRLPHHPGSTAISEQARPTTSSRPARRLDPCSAFSKPKKFIRYMPIPATKYAGHASHQQARNADQQTIFVRSRPIPRLIVSFVQTYHPTQLPSKW